MFLEREILQRDDLYHELNKYFIDKFIQFIENLVFFFNKRLHDLKFSAFLGFYILKEKNGILIGSL